MLTDYLHPNNAHNTWCYNGELLLHVVYRKFQPCSNYSVRSNFFVAFEFLLHSN